MPLVQSGRLLIARPSVDSPPFARSVVLLFQHEPKFGSMGVVVNRPTSVKLAEVVEKVEALTGREDRVWLGGPVQPNAVWILHRRCDVAEPGAKVGGGLFLGGSPGLLEELVRSTSPNPAPQCFRVLRGYAGWAPGQLAREIREGSWHVIDADEDLIFGADSDPQWVDFITRAQLPFRLSSHALRNASFN